MPDLESDPRHHTQKMKQRFTETVTHLREDIEKVDDPQIQGHVRNLG